MLEMTRHDFTKTGSVQTNTQYGKAALKRERERERETSFSLCLSRACLGKMIAFIYKLLKKVRFLAAEIAYALALVRKHTNGTFCAAVFQRNNDEHFAKTGSGQTYRESSSTLNKSTAVFFSFLAGVGPHTSPAAALRYVHSAQCTVGSLLLSCLVLLLSCLVLHVC
eukprot:COSAG06_NODE_6959_length_2698_cov_81.008080_2_plen_167_part_00